MVALEAMKRLNKQTPNEVYFVFTVQEEVGVRGARVSAFGVDPDVAIALDVTSTGDMVKNPKMAVKLGGGAAIKLHDPGWSCRLPCATGWSRGRKPTASPISWKS